MSTDSFILALRRVISRRGKPNNIWSDNGSNFVGAKRELREVLKTLDRSKICNHLNNRSIQWKFIPPASPWVGGAWEALVKITKKALRSVTHDRPVYEESLVTFLTEVESTLNSRPLTPVSYDINNFNVVTPNHFLISRANFNSAELRPWRSVQALKNMFWDRFLREYLPILNVRRKWKQLEQNFKVNDDTTNGEYTSVIWPLGHIIEK